MFIACLELQAELLSQRRVVHGLPKLWLLAKLFSLECIEQRKPRDPGMRHMATISRQGLPAVFSMPQPLTPIPLDQPCMPSLLTQQAAVSAPLPAFNNDHPNLPPIAPTTTTAQTDSTPGLAGVPLHQDGVCNSNPACQQADLLMTEGAFACLTGIWAPSYRLAWELPVTIRATASSHSDDPQTSPPSVRHAKQVIIESPLPRRKLSLREKHELLYQHAVRKLGCDLWTRQQHARRAAQASVAERPAAHQQPDHQQHEQQQQQQQAEEHMYAPYSPSNDVPVDAPYSPSTDPYIYDQQGMYNMPNSLTPTVADLPSTAVDAAPHPTQGKAYFLGDADTTDDDDNNSEANAFAHAVLGDGDDEPISMQAQIDASAADPSAGSSADAQALANVIATGGNDPCAEDDPHRVAATAEATATAEAATTAGAAHTTAEAQAGPTDDAAGDTTAAAADDATAEAGELDDRAQGTTGEAAREGVAYDSWQLGDYKLVIRTQLPAHLVHNPPPQVAFPFPQAAALSHSPFTMMIACTNAHCLYKDADLGCLHREKESMSTYKQCTCMLRCIDNCCSNSLLCLIGNCNHTILDAEQTVLPWKCSRMPVLCHCHLYMHQICRVTDTASLLHFVAPWAAPTQPHAPAPEEQVGSVGCEDGVPGGVGL